MTFQINNKTYLTLNANDFSAKGDIVNLCKSSKVYDGPKNQYTSQKTPVLLSNLTHHRFIFVESSHLVDRYQPIGGEPRASGVYHPNHIYLDNYTKKAIALILHRAGVIDTLKLLEFTRPGSISKGELIYKISNRCPSLGSNIDYRDLCVFTINTGERITQSRFLDTGYIHPRPIHRLTINTPPPNLSPSPRHLNPSPIPVSNQPHDYGNINPLRFISDMPIIKVDDNILPHHIALRLLSKDDNCIICLDDLSEDTILVTKCGHFYCKECLAKTISLDNPKCGECRTEFK